MFEAACTENPEMTLWSSLNYGISCKQHPYQETAWMAPQSSPRSRPSHYLPVAYFPKMTITMSSIPHALLHHGICDHSS